MIEPQDLSFHSGITRDEDGFRRVLIELWPLLNGITGLNEALEMGYYELDWSNYPMPEDDAYGKHDDGSPRCGGWKLRVFQEPTNYEDAPFCANFTFDIPRGADIFGIRVTDNVTEEVYRLVSVKPHSIGVVNDIDMDSSPEFQMGFTYGKRAMAVQISRACDEIDGGKTAPYR